MTKNKALYEFMEYLPFLKELVKRDFKMKYYKSFLGVLWTLLNPLILATIMTIIFSTLFKRSIEYYPIYNISGHLILTFFVTATKQSLSSVYHHAGVFRKFKVPQYMYCLSNVTIAFITLLFSSVPMLILALVLGMPLHFTMLLFPLPIILFAYSRCIWRIFQRFKPSLWNTHICTEFPYANILSNWNYPCWISFCMGLQSPISLYKNFKRGFHL